LKNIKLASLSIWIILFLPTIASASGFRDALGTVLGVLGGIVGLIIGWVIFPLTLSLVQMVVKSPLELFFARLTYGATGAFFGFAIVFSLVAGHAPGDKPSSNISKSAQPVTQTAQVINTKDFNQNAEDTVRLFYGWISEGRYAEVYDEVFSEYRKSKITKEGFIGGFRNTISVIPLEVRTTQQDDSTARVAVKVKSLDRSETGGPEIEKVFQGEWVLVKSDGLWLLDRSNIRQVSVTGEEKTFSEIPQAKAVEEEKKREEALPTQQAKPVKKQVGGQVPVSGMLNETGQQKPQQQKPSGQAGEQIPISTVIEEQEKKALQAETKKKQEEESGLKPIEMEDVN